MMLVTKYPTLYAFDPTFKNVKIGIIITSNKRKGAIIEHYYLGKKLDKKYPYNKFYIVQKPVNSTESQALNYLAIVTKHIIHDLRVNHNYSPLLVDYIVEDEELVPILVKLQKEFVNIDKIFIVKCGEAGCKKVKEFTS